MFYSRGLLGRMAAALRAKSSRQKMEIRICEEIPMAVRLSRIILDRCGIVYHRKVDPNADELNLALIEINKAWNVKSPLQCLAVRLCRILTVRSAAVCQRNVDPFHDHLNLALVEINEARKVNSALQCLASAERSLVAPSFAPQITGYNQNYHQEIHYIAILWDVENCKVPRGVVHANVLPNIKKFLERVIMIKQPAIIFPYASTNFASFSEEEMAEFATTGFTTMNTSSTEKQAADVLIVHRMYTFAYRYNPGTIVLISGDGRYSDHLDILRDEGMQVINIVPSNATSKKLLASPKPMWDWAKVVKEEYY